LFNATPALIATRQAALNLIASQQATNNLTGMAPVITTGSADNATKDVAYSFQIPATGGTAPYTFAITGGSLPVGLSMNGDGLITGTPTVSATSTFTVSILDDEGNQCSRDVSLVVSVATTWCTDGNTLRLKIQGYTSALFTNCDACLFLPGLPVWDGKFPEQSSDIIQCIYFQKGINYDVYEQFNANAVLGTVEVIKVNFNIAPFTPGFWYVYIRCAYAGSDPLASVVLWQGSKPTTLLDPDPTGTYTYESGCSSGVASLVIESYQP
jgi:hypothetical protein